MRRRLVPAAAFLFFSGAVGAQQIDTLPPARTYHVKHVPVTQPAGYVHLPSAATAFSGTADILRRFTGVQVKDYGGVGGLKTVNVRSLGSEHVGIFLDDIQIENAQNMQVDLGRYPTDGIGSIALYNGPHDDRLLTAKAYAAGAVICMNTVAPSYNTLQVRLRGGSFGTFHPSVLWEKKFGKISLRTGAEWLSADGRYKYPFFDTTLVRENGDIRALRLQVQLFGETRNGRWQLHGHSYGSERGFPGPVLRRGTGLPFSAERQADQDFFLQGSWRTSWTEQYATAVRFKYADEYIHYDTHPERNPMALPYDLHYRQKSGYLSVAQSWVPAPSWSVDLSTDIQYNTLDSDAGQSVSPERFTFTGALATKFVREHFRAAAHLAWQGAQDLFGTPQAGGWSRENAFRDTWMPSLTLAWKPVPSFEISAFAKRSFRLPSFNDLYYTQMGNSDLAPESAFQTGMDLRYDGYTGPEHGLSWEFRLSPYYNRVSDKIVAIPTVSQFRWTMLNIGRADITGLDAAADFSLHKRSWEGGLTLRYSFQQALDHSTSGSLTWGNQLPYIPRHSGGADLFASMEGWTLSWSGTFTGGRWSRTANIADYYIRPWTISTLTIEKTILLDFRSRKGTSIPELKVGLVIDNVFDTPYQVVQGYPMPGRNAMLSLTFNR